MKKVMSKRGQSEGMGLGTILALIVGGVAVVLIIIGFSMGADKVFSLLGFAPDDLNSAAIACSSYAGEPSLALSYCQYRELTIDNQKQWVNCNHIYVKAETSLGTGKAGYNIQTCEVDEKEYCEILKAKTGYDGKDYVNGNTCVYWGVPVGEPVILP